MGSINLKDTPTHQGVMKFNDEMFILVDRISAEGQPDEFMLEFTDKNGIVWFTQRVEAPAIEVVLINDLAPSTAPDTIRNTIVSIASAEASLQSLRKERRMELYFNTLYAKEHCPKLMLLGFTGGFGCHRASMVKAMEGGDMVRAERYFWILAEQTLIETHRDLLGEERPLAEHMDMWFERVMSEPDEPMWDEIRHFIREVPASTETKWSKMIERTSGGKI